MIIWFAVAMWPLARVAAARRMMLPRAAMLSDAARPWFLPDGSPGPPRWSQREKIRSPISGSSLIRGGADVSEREPDSGSQDASFVDVNVISYRSLLATREDLARRRYEANETGEDAVKGNKCRYKKPNTKCPFELWQKTQFVKLYNVGKKTLERVTSMNKCKEIKKNGKVKASPKGIYGPGVYLAASCKIGHMKMDPINRAAAKKEGGLCCVTAKVDIKKAVVPTVEARATWLNKDFMKKMGAEAVWAKAGRVHKLKSSKEEYVVYDMSILTLQGTRKFEPPNEIKSKGRRAKAKARARQGNRRRKRRRRRRRRRGGKR